jgi:dihydropteroate synthase
MVPQRPKRLYANLAGVEVGDGFPVRVVGVINVSPESFHKGSVAVGVRRLQRLAVKMVAEGADILDIGAMSTAPYLKGAISEAEELRRVRVAMSALREVVSVPLSIDTQRGAVAAAALGVGAAIINDVSGLGHDAAMTEVAHAAEGFVLMAAQTQKSNEKPLALVLRLLRQCLERARKARLPAERIVLDPGIGFLRQGALPWYEVDCAVLAALPRLQRLGRPLLVGVSRKSFIGRLTGRAEPAQRLHGSVAAAAIAAFNGAALVRTHDVAATVDAVRVATALRRSG